MKRNGGKLVLASVLLGCASVGVMGAGHAAAAPLPSSAPAPSSHSVTPLSHGWVTSVAEDFEGNGGPVTPVTDSGPTVPGQLASSNVLSASMAGAKGTYHLQVALPVGQTFQVGRGYDTGEDQASILVSWPGGGCASQGFSGNGTFTVTQLTPGVVGATTSYGITFTCYSTEDVVEGAMANNMTPSLPKQGYYTFGPEGWIQGSGNNDYLDYLGSLFATQLNASIVGMATTPDGGGYWLVASDGGIFAFGDARFEGSMGAKPLNQPIVGMATTTDGQGYWLVASDGGIFAFGDAGFHGSMGGKPLDDPIVGMTGALGGGYRMVASDGGIFAFGGASFYGSMGGKVLNAPIAGMASTPDGHGYWMVASDGGVFSFGDAGYHGSAAALSFGEPVAGMASTADGNGYWLAGYDDSVFAFGDAPFFGSASAFQFFDVVGIAT